MKRLFITAVLVLPAIVVLSSFSYNASATEIDLYGTSPSFSPDTSWSKWVGYLGAGDLLYWAWSSADSLSFAVYTSPDMTWYYGFSNYDGLVVEESGHYNLWWYNNNWFFSATVTYAILAFTPSLEVTTPENGDYLSTTSVSVQGTYDGYADGILVGPDALHFQKAETEGTNWGLDDYELEEGQNTILVRSYYWLDAYGYENHTIDRTIMVTLDNESPQVVIVYPEGIYDDCYVAGLLRVEWECSDNCGISETEVRVDEGLWKTFDGTEYTAELTDGVHRFEVRVTDLAGNTCNADRNFISDTVQPELEIGGPVMNAKVSEDLVTVSWTGSDALSGIDHYEVRISGGDWIDVGTATAYTFTGLEDKWYSVTIRAVDKSGNTEESTVGFGIYTSIWSTNGPYNGIPLFALIAAIIIGAVLTAMLFRRRRGGPAVTTAPEEPSPEQPLEGVPAAE